MKSEEFDELFRREIDGLDGLPPDVSWSKESGWEKLNQQLTNPTGKRAILPLLPIKNILGSYWTYAAAAAITLMVASVYSVKNYWTIIDNQPAKETLAAAKGNQDPYVSQGKTGQTALEESIVFSEELKEMSGEKMKNALNPFFITDSQLKNQLLVYNNYFNPAKNRDEVLSGILATKADFPSSMGFWPFLIGKGAEYEVKPPQNANSIANYQNTFSSKSEVAAEKKSAPLAVVVGSNLSVIDRNLNLGVEGAILFKLFDLEGKPNQVVGIGLDSRYQFFTMAENDSPQDNLNTIDRNEVNNGFNTFVTASYSRNLSGKDKKPFWLGMKAGYLLQDNTNNFDDSTLMLEMIVGGNDSSKFKVSPQVYLTDNLKRVMPGIKLGMTLGKFDREASI